MQGAAVAEHAALQALESKLHGEALWRRVFARLDRGSRLEFSTPFRNGDVSRGYRVPGSGCRIAPNLAPDTQHPAPDDMSPY